MKILSAIAITGISISTSIIMALPSPAQTPNSPPPQNPPTISNNWKDYANIEAGFMQNCVGKQPLTPEQKLVKQNFCQCNFNSFKTRYTPQVFFQVNALVIKIGQDGNTLVNLMIKPEADICIAKTGYRP